MKKSARSTYRNLGSYTYLHEVATRTCTSNEPRLVYAVLMNSATLTANYSIKQSQLTKLTSETRAMNPKEFNEAFDRAIRE